MKTKKLVLLETIERMEMIIWDLSKETMSVSERKRQGKRLMAMLSEVRIISKKLKD